MTTSNTSIDTREGTGLEKDTDLENAQNTTTGLEKSEFGVAPDGGLQAWLAAAGGFSICFGCLGFTSCYGVLQEYYSTHQLRDKTTDDVAWIGSLASFMQFAGGAVGGPVFDRFGVWVSTPQRSRVERILTVDQILRPATLLYVFGLMMVSISSEYYQFILAQGVLMGSAMAFLQFPAFAMVSQYFDKKRGAALGFMVSGSSIGGVVFTIVL